MHKNNSNVQNKAMKKESIKVIILSFCAGMISGFFSSGGGMLLVPFFTHVVKLDEIKARGTSVFCIVFFVVTSVFFYTEKKYVDYGLGIKCAIGGIIRSFFREQTINENR